MAVGTKLRLGFVGASSAFTALPLRAAARSGHALVGIVESFPHAAPEGATPLRAFAERRRVAYLALSRTNLADFLRSQSVDLLLIAGCHRLLTRAEFSIPVMGALNFHPSLLPAYRGAHPLFWQYREFDLRGGITLHAVDTRADTGDVVGQIPFAIPLGQTAGATLQHAATLAGELVRETLSDIAARVAIRRPQLAGEYPAAPTPMPADLIPDYAQWSLDRTWHFLRGLNEMYELFPEQRIGPRMAGPAPSREPPGQIVADKRGLLICHPAGQIRLLPARSPSVISRVRASLAARALWR